jgi:mannose-6-phosphate isomerase-like protein (cupin superfamily)
MTTGDTRSGALEYDERPWGYYQVIDEGAGFKVKRISVRPGHRLSYQRHDHRSEHWFFVRGDGSVTIDDDVRPVSAGTSVDIGVGVPHRVTNSGSDDVVFIETQVGDYLGEDDIVRLDDDYDR